jgi:hypothetical protein
MLVGDDAIARGWRARTCRAEIARPRIAVLAVRPVGWSISPYHVDHAVDHAVEQIVLVVLNLDMDYEVAVVMGKGRRPRSCPFGPKTGQALDRYLRVRSRHKHAKLAEVWLATAGHCRRRGSARC